MNDIKSTKNPFFSIITVTFNAEKNISITLKSLLIQSYTNFELIIIDGDSSDNTVKIIKESKIASIIIKEKDKGIYDAMNKGIKLAKGEFTCFLNAGDAFASTNLLEQVYVFIMKKNISGVLFGDSLYLKNNKSTSYVKANPFFLNSKSYGSGLCHQSCFFETKVIKEEKYNLNYPISSDFELMYRLYNKNISYNYFPFAISIYETDNGFSARNRIRSFKECVKIANRKKSLRYYITLHKFIMKFILRFILSKMRLR